MIISPRITNEARFNWTAADATADARLDNFGGAQPLTPEMLFPAYASAENSRAGFLISGGTGTNLAEGRNAANAQKQINVVDTVSFARSKHLFKIGIDVRGLRPAAGNIAHQLSATFSSVGDPTKSTDQQVPGSFLSGTISSGSAITRPAHFGMRYLNVSSFVQDTWRLAQRVTITYGVRWDIDPPPTGTDGTNLFALTSLQSLSTLALAPTGTPLWRTDYKTFAPRLGIAYRLRNAPDWALILRAGSGVFYDLTGGYLGNQPTFPPNAATRPLVAGTLYPYSGSAITPPSLPSSAPYVNAFAVDPNIKTARVYQWNTALEQEVGRYGIVSATYVGAVGRDLARATTINVPSPTFTSVVIDQSNAVSDFQALQVQFRGRIGPRIQVLSSYSWSHSIDTASSDIVSSAPPFSQIDSKSDRGPSDFDTRQSFSAALTVSSPSMGGSWLSPLLRDWSLDSIIQARTAFPFAILVQRDLGYGAYTYRPDIVSGLSEYISDPNTGGGKRLDTMRPPGVSNQVGAYIIPTERRQGNLGRNATRGFGMYQVDIGLRREFRLREGFRLQIKAELFNLLNHPNFADPSGVMGAVSPTGVLTFSPLFGRSPSMLGSQLGAGGVNGGLSPLYQIGGPRSSQLSMKLIF